MPLSNVLWHHRSKVLIFERDPCLAVGYSLGEAKAFPCEV